MDSAPPISKLRWLSRALVVVLLLLTAGYVLVILFWPVQQTSGRRFHDLHGNLQQIGRARLIFEIDHNDGLPPEALTDAYAFAAYLARTGNWDYSRAWFYLLDPVWRGNPHLPEAILSPAQDKLHAPISPNFQSAPLAWAVALVPSAVKLPAATPLIWTRGLRPDGTWREDGTECGEGGAILFVGGNVNTYHGKIDGKLHKFNTEEPTSNIIEALPPGTRISEYTPPPEVAGYAHELVQQERREQANAAGRKSPLLLELLATVLACSFLVAYPRCNWLRRLAGIIVGTVCAVWFWGALPR